MPHLNQPWARVNISSDLRLKLIEISAREPTMERKGGGSNSISRGILASLRLSGKSWQRLTTGQT